MPPDWGRQSEPEMKLGSQYVERYCYNVQLELEQMETDNLYEGRVWWTVTPFRTHCIGSAGKNGFMLVMFYNDLKRRVIICESNCEYQ